MATKQYCIDAATYIWRIADGAEITADDYSRIRQNNAGNRYGGEFENVAETDDLDEASALQNAIAM